MPHCPFTHGLKPSLLLCWLQVGENQYKAEHHGLQDARKGVLFESFPPVLQLQLKRFEYDFQRDAMVKVGGGC